MVAAPGAEVLPFCGERQGVGHVLQHASGIRRSPTCWACLVCNSAPWHRVKCCDKNLTPRCESAISEHLDRQSSQRIAGSGLHLCWWRRAARVIIIFV